MSKAIAIAQREIQERAFVLVVAAAATAVPFLVPFMPWERGTLSERMAEVKLVGDVITVGYVLTLAALLGASIVGRELREKRLSFYFARPVSGSAIWFGKMIASLFLLAASATILSLPPTLLVRNAGRNGWWTLSTPALIGIVMVIGFSLLLFVHAAATMLRSRSPLIAVDFVAAVTFVAVTTYLLAGIAVHQAVQLVAALALSVLIAVATTLFFAGAWQLSRGRIDAKRGHRELSLFTWSCLAACAMVLAAVTAWVSAVGISDLTSKYARQTGNGAALQVEGIARHRLDYHAQFLTDVATGRTMPIGPLGGLSVATSGDGRKAAWIEPSSTTMINLLLYGGRPRTLDLRLMSVGLGQSDGPVDTGIEIGGWAKALELSQDGSRVAVMTSGIVKVYDIARRRSIGSALVPAHLSWDARLQFVTQDDVRIFVRDGDRKSNVHLVAYDFPLRQRALRRILDVDLPLEWMQYEPSADGRRLIARASRGGKAGEPPVITVIVFDLTTGKQLFEIVPPAGARTLGAWLFADGRTATLTLGRAAQSGGVHQLTVNVFDAAGSALRTIGLGAAARGRIEGEIEPGVLAVSSSTTPWSGQLRRNEARWALTRIDTSSGATGPIADGVAPVIEFPFGVGTTPTAARSTRVFSDPAADNYVAVDLRTGARRKLP